MSSLVNRMGFYSAVTITCLVVFIDVGMIASNLLYPITTITSIEAYAAQFSPIQMLPFVPSLILAPIFVILISCIYHAATEEKKILGQLGFAFAVVCAAILSLHYYIQLTIVQQGLISGDLAGLWQFATPNPNSLFWTFAALGYGFMGFALLSVASIFSEKTDRPIKWLFVANGLVGVAFLVGNALGIFAVNVLASFIWGVLFPIATILLAKRFRAK
ncbi:MAG TPA: hypothetical protein V6C97_21735 [Oculatellaceae cyanobacterium]